MLRVCAMRVCVDLAATVRLYFHTLDLIEYMSDGARPFYGRLRPNDENGQAIAQFKCLPNNWKFIL